MAPVIDEKDAFSNGPAVKNIIQNRHQTLKEVGELETEIARLSLPKKNLRNVSTKRQ
jgi:hypothetical protein